jgi:hypothetical protein
MSDYYPSIRLIVAIFYFAFWFFKGIRPFNIWWLVLIYAIDYIIALITVSIMERAVKRNFG